MLNFLVILFSVNIISAKSPYTCGQNEIRNRPYGGVELRVKCEYMEEYNSISVLEYKKGTRVQHGIAIHYDSLWRKHDSLFFVNGKENGHCIFWDTLGNVIGRKTYRNGLYIGRQESYWSPGHPSVIKNYNSKGNEDGPWAEWWKNGNKKAEFIAKNGEIVSGTEYYQNGKPRVHFVTKYEPKNKNVFKMKYIQAESWAPNGKPAGQIVNGNGEWILFPDGKASADSTVFREVYKDSLMIKGEKLDSAEVESWLKP
jgi:antitoxin component YwqK of YwqJK toxin-antitoxin module